MERSVYEDMRLRITVRTECTADELGLMEALDKVVRTYNNDLPPGIATVDTPSVVGPEEISRAVAWLKEKWG